MAVLQPLKIVLVNYPEGQVEELEAENNPNDEAAGSRKVLFSRELYIEREDFMEEAPKKYFRLTPNQEVRLKYAYIIKCEEVIKDEAGNIVEVRCSYDPESKSGGATSGRKVKGTLHWVSAQHAVRATVRLYDYLFINDNPEDENSYTLNPNSLETLTDCLVEPSLAAAQPGTRYQFLRQGYFCADAVEHTTDKPVFNRVVGLRDSWAKAQK
jgi:glutaminyl-tRNA synthetase